MGKLPFFGRFWIIQFCLSCILGYEVVVGASRNHFVVSISITFVGYYGLGREPELLGVSLRERVKRFSFPLSITMVKKLLICGLIIHSIYSVQAQQIDSLVAATVEQAEVLRTKEGNFAGAIEMLERVLGELQAQGVEDGLSLVPLYHKLGVNYYSFGAYLQAEPYISKALSIREQAFGKVHIDVAKGYYVRAVLNKELQLYKEAQQDMEAAISSMETLLETGASTADYRLIWMFEESVSLHTILRNNTLALQFWDKAYAYYAQDEEAAFIDLSILYDYKGKIYYNQRKYDLSEAAYVNAIELYQRYGQAGSLPEAIANIYSNWGVMQFQQGKYTEARNSYQIAQKGYEQLLEATESPRFYQSLGVVYANLLELAGKEKKYDKVDLYSSKAQEYYLQGFGTFYHPNVATLYRDHAQIEMDRGQTQSALALNQKAIQALIPDFTAEDLLAQVSLSEYVVKDKISFLETLRQRAGLLLTMSEERGGDAEYLSAAFQHYLTLDTVVTQIRQSYNAAGSQFDLIEQSYPIYEQAVRTALLLAEQTGNSQYMAAAYNFAARNKALVLLGGIQEQHARTYSSIPDELQEQERNLKKAILQLEIDLYKLGDDANLGQLKDSLFTLQRNHQRLIRHFETAFPDYYASKYGFDQGIEISAFRQQLEGETAVLEYFVGEENLFVFVITREGFDYQMMAKPANFEQVAWSFREQVQTQSQSSEEMLQRSYQLYQWLCAEALAKPVINNNINHLVIIPDGVLMQLPFDVLIEKPNSEVTSYLLRRYAISYAYSNRLLFGKDHSRSTAGTFAGFGLEYDDYTLADLSNYVNNPQVAMSLTRALGKLQYADDEVSEIATLLSGDQWINSEATRASFMENADQYAILHLAMHGVLNEEYPMNSALVFTRQNDSTEYFLRAADLYNMQLNADMTVLSACNTGAGALQKGEGVRSLARAFSYAGCPSLVASPWNASDKSTKDILFDFYQNLKAGMSKHEAMRQAKLAYIDGAPPAYSLPFYWSHLSVIGDSRALEVLSSSSLKRYGLPVAIAVLALVAGFLWFRKR